MGGFQSAQDFDKFLAGPSPTKPSNGTSIWGMYPDLDKLADAITTHEGKQGNLNFRNNNPGNLKFVGQPGAKAGDRGFAVFSDMTTGRKALLEQLRRYKSKYPNITAHEFINGNEDFSGYSPDTDPDNPPGQAQAYAEHLIKSGSPAASTAEEKRSRKAFSSAADLDEFLKQPHTGADAQAPHNEPKNTYEYLFGFTSTPAAKGEEHAAGAYDPGLVGGLWQKARQLPVAGKLTLGELLDSRVKESPLGGVKDRSKADDLAHLQKRGLNVVSTIEAVQAGVGDSIQGLTSGENLAIMGAMTLVSPLRAARMLIDAGFAAEMARGAAEGFKAGYDAWEQGDHVAALRYFTSAPVNTVMAALAGVHLGYEGYQGVKGHIEFSKGRAVLDESAQAKFREPFERLTPEQKAEVAYDVMRIRPAPITLKAAKKLGLEHPSESLGKSSIADVARHQQAVAKAKDAVAEIAPQAFSPAPEPLERAPRSQNVIVNDSDIPILNAPVMDARERMFARQEQMERDARATLQREREAREKSLQQKMDEHKRLAQKERQEDLDAIARKRDEEIQKHEAAEAQAPQDRRTLRPAFEAARQNLARYRQINEAMQEFAQRYVGGLDKGAVVDVADDVKANPITRTLEILTAARGEPGASLSPEEQDFLRMNDERKRALRQSDWRSLEPEHAEVREFTPSPDEAAKPRSSEAPKPKLIGARLKQLGESHAEGFSDAFDRAMELLSGLSDDEVAEHLHPENRKRHAAGEALENVIDGKPDFAAAELIARYNQLLAELDMVGREQDLREASTELSRQSQTAASPEQADELSKEAMEARELAEKIDRERRESLAAIHARRRQDPDVYPIGTPVSMIEGRAGKVFLTDGRVLAVHYAVVPMRYLVVSHDPYRNFEVVPMFPQVAQPRDYKNNKELQTGVLSGAKKFNPEEIFNTAGTPVDGPPIIRRDGIVMGGNGRTMRAMLAYGGEKSEEIVQHLLDHAGEFGIDPSQVPTTEEPIVVRVLDDDVTDVKGMKLMGQDLNIDPSMGKSAAETSVSMAQRMTPELVEWANRARDAIGDEASTREFMRFRGGEIVNKMVAAGMIPANKLSEYITPEGEMTEKAKDLWESAVRGSYIPNAELLATAPKSVLNKLDRADVYLLKLKGSPLWDIGDYVIEALRLWKRVDSVSESLDQIGKKTDSIVEKYLRPENFTGGTRSFVDRGVHPAVEAIARLLESAGTEVKKAIKGYADDAEGNQMMLGPPPNPRDSFNRNIGEKSGVEVSAGEWGQIEAAKKGESDLEAARRGASGEPPEDFAVNRVPVEQRASTLLAKEAEEKFAQRVESRELTPVPEAAGEPATKETAEKQTATAVAEPPSPLPMPAGPMTESRLRVELAKHPGMSAGKINAVVEVWKRFAEKYAGVPFDQWLKERIADIRFMPEEQYRASDKSLTQSMPEEVAGKIKAAGALPAEMENVEEIKQVLGMDIEDPLVYFNDPETHSTLALPLSQVSEEAVQRHMEESRARFQGKAKAAAAGPSQLFQDFKIGMTPDELHEFVKQSGRNLRIENYGEQGNLFTGAEKQYRIWNKVTKESTLVTESQLEGLRGINSFLDRMAEQPGLFGPPQGTLFQGKANGAAAGPSKLFQEKLGDEELANEANIHRSDPVAQKWTQDVYNGLRRAGVDRAYILKNIGSFEDDAKSSTPQQIVEYVLKNYDPRLRQGKKGATDFLSDGRAVVSLFEQSDVSTLLHEGFHVFRRNMKPEDVAVLEREFKVKDGVWNTHSEEKAARAYERYWHEGEAPTPELKSLFAKIKAWMLDVYRTIKRTAIDIKISPDVRKVFDKTVRGGGNVPDWVTENRGRWFTPERKVAYGYAGESGDMLVVDVPKAVADSTDFGSLPGRPERILPEEWAKRGIKEDAAGPVQEGMVRLYRGQKPFDEMSDGEVVDSIPEAKPETAKDAAATLDLTPADMDGAQLVAEGGEDISGKETRQKPFGNQGDAFAWAQTNRDNLKGLKIFNLSDGRAVAQFLPKSETVLFQDANDSERKIRAIKQRLSSVIPDAERSRLGKILQQLEAEKALPAAAAPKAVESPQSFTPPPAEPGRVIKLWTPEGEREVASGKPETDIGRRALDAPPEPAQRRGPERVAEPAGQPAGARADEPAGRAVRKGGESERRGRPDPRPRAALRDVASTRIAAPVRDRGPAIYTPQDWERRTKDFRLPSNAPIPDVALLADIRRMLIFPGQPEVAEIALSGLKQHDGVVIATSTGTGKTYLASAILSQLVKPDSKVLVLTMNQDLIHDGANGFISVARDFDVHMQELPSGVGDPGQPGVYATTYQAAIGRDGIIDANWDLVVADEIGAARRWYASQRGAMMRDLANKSTKIVWMSATPFHTALEIGHMDKLGLWRDEGFGSWAKQFGVFKDKDGNWAGGNAPRKLVKLRQQLIERGQYVNLDRIMEGYKAHFSVVPMDEETRQGVRNIDRAFKRAEEYFRRKGKMSMLRAVRGNAVTFMKNYLERQRLPQAIELARKAEKEGWKVIFMSENKSEVPEIFDFLKPADEFYGGEISQLLPKLPGVVETLEKEFGDDIANFSGKHSAARSAEKDAFKGNRKSHIYLTYGAGGIGISLHDTQGTHPRLAIYLGPPWSGVMLDQAIGRPWRFGTKSNVHAIFLTSNAKPEMQLVLEKIAPRFESLKAMVSGIDKGDPLVTAMRSLDESREQTAAFDLGQEQKSSVEDFLETTETAAVVNWKNTPIESSETAKNQGMKFPEGVEVQAHPGVVRLFQDEPEPPPDFLLPEDSEARQDSEGIQESFIAGRGAPGWAPKLIGEIPEQLRDDIARGVAVMAEADAAERDSGKKEAVYAKWKQAAEYVDSSRPRKGFRFIQDYYFTNSRKLVKKSGERAGVPELGAKIAQKFADYHIEKGNIAGPLQLEYFDMVARHKLSKAEHANMILAKKGLQPPMNERVASAVTDLTALYNKARKQLEDQGIYVSIFDRSTGTQRKVFYADIVDDPTYVHQRLDADHEIAWTDENGETQKTTLKELMDGKPGDARYERIIRSLMRRFNQPRAKVEDYLASRRRGTPLAGGVERAREYDIPFFRLDMAAQMGYLNDVGEVIARKKVWGQEREKIDPMILDIPGTENRKVVRGVVDSVLARVHEPEDPRAFKSWLADWEILSKMTMSSIKVLSHAGHMGLMANTRAVLKGLYHSVADPKLAYRRAIFSGAVQEQWIANLMMDEGASRSITQKALRFTGYSGIYSAERALADATARVFMEQYALPELKRNPQHVYRRYLQNYYGQADNTIERAIERGAWGPEDIERAAKAFADRSMFTTDASEMPVASRYKSDDPGGAAVAAPVRLLYMFKSYTLKTAGLINDAFIGEIRKGNFRPLVPFFVIYPLLGEAVQDLYSMLTFNPKRFEDLAKGLEKNDSWDLVKRYVGDIGFMLGQHWFWDTAKSGYSFADHMVSETLGPVYDDAKNSLIFAWEMKNAKDNKRIIHGHRTGADEKRWKAFVKWMEQTVPATRVATRALGIDSEPKKADYKFTPAPSR